MSLEKAAMWMDMKKRKYSYRWYFVKRYLSFEQKLICWIQKTELEAAELKEEGVISKQGGYHYIHPATGKAMVEYHVDTYYLFHER
jgi:hypothetical protein